MGASARNYAVAEVIKGPVDIWLDVAAPVGDTEVTIDSTSDIHTPESVANPSAVHLGMTKGGISILIKPTTENSTSDELTSPYRSNLTEEEVVISVKGALQFTGTAASRFATTAKLLLGSTASTPTGKRKIKGGGLSTVTFRTIMAIWANAETPSKYEYLLLYRSFNDAGLAFDLSRTMDASADLAFRGFADPARSAGDTIYQWVAKT